MSVLIHHVMFHRVIFHNVIFHRVIFQHLIVHRIIFHHVIFHRVIFHDVVFDRAMFHPSVPSMQRPPAAWQGDRSGAWGGDGVSIHSFSFLSGTSSFVTPVYRFSVLSWAASLGARTHQPLQFGDAAVHCGCPPPSPPPPPAPPRALVT